MFFHVEQQNGKKPQGAVTWKWCGGQSALLPPWKSRIKSILSKATILEAQQATNYFLCILRPLPFLLLCLPFPSFSICKAMSHVIPACTLVNLASGCFHRPYFMQSVAIIATISIFCSFCTTCPFSTITLLPCSFSQSRFLLKLRIAFMPSCHICIQFQSPQEPKRAISLSPTSFPTPTVFPRSQNAVLNMWSARGNMPSACVLLSLLLSLGLHVFLMYMEELTRQQDTFSTNTSVYDNRKKGHCFGGDAVT